MSQQQLAVPPSGPSLELKSIPSVSSLPPSLPGHTLRFLFFSVLFFLFMSDQIELVGPLMQGLPKHVGEFKLRSENE